MKNKQAAIISAFAIITIFAVTAAWAGASGKAIDLESTRAHPDATGTALIDREHVSVQARGLKPESVYTVWLVNMKPKKHETGAGLQPYMFLTDSWGNGSYSAPLENAPFGKWSMVMVVLHPTGDPGDMKNMVGALKARL